MTRAKLALVLWALLLAVCFSYTLAMEDFSKLYYYESNVIMIKSPNTCKEMHILCIIIYSGLYSGPIIQFHNSNYQLAMN